MGNLIVLSDHERERFITYLTQEAETNDGLAGQFGKLGGRATELIAKSHRMVAAACAILIKDLERGEQMTISGGTEAPQ